VTVLDERLRQPLRSASTLSTLDPSLYRRSQKVQVPLFDAVIKVGHAPEVPA
jgi:hypothetical protein